MAPEAAAAAVAGCRAFGSASVDPCLYTAPESAAAFLKWVLPLLYIAGDVVVTVPRAIVVDAGPFSSVGHTAVGIPEISNMVI